jgi:Na+/melibiose symporter-like transporter
MPPFSALISTLKNKPFLQFVIISMIMSTAFTVVTAMLPYYVIYQLDMKSAMSIIMMLILVVLALFSVPCQMVRRAHRQHKAYALGLVIACARCSFPFSCPTTKRYSSTLSRRCRLGFFQQWVGPPV